MVCRLCLANVNVENRVTLFNTVEQNGESEIVKLIAKYFYLEITQQDAISTTICQECCNHLEEFNTFCQYVERQQGMLRNEFLEVKCDSDSNAPNANDENDVDYNQQDALSELKDVLMTDNTVQLEEQPIADQTKSEADKHNVFEDKEASGDSDEDRLAEDDNRDDDDGTDDDIPLQKLLTKSVKTARKPRKCKNIKSKSADSSTKNTTTSGDEESCNELAVTKRKTRKSKNLKTATDATTASPRKYKRINGLESHEVDEFIAKHMQLKCELCETLFEKFADMRPHFKEQHDCRSYIMCCGNRFILRKDLYDHINWHLNPEFFKCEHCGKVLKNRYSLNVHNMNKHLKQEDLIYNCDICSKGFARPSLLTKHIMYHKAKKTFTCDICTKSFILKQSLEKHIRSMHENIYEHICDVCGKKFKCKPSFETHVLEHQGIIEPPMQCQVCLGWLKNKHRLRLHMATHNNIDVKCKYCGRICPTQRALRGHIQYMHRRPPSHQCKYCQKFFKTATSLKEHVATHTGENLYTCPHCGREFRSKANMYVHIKRQHQQEWLAAQLARPSKAPPNVENTF